MIATEDGRKSWELDPDKPDTGEGMKLPVIQQLVITDDRLTVDELERTRDAAVALGHGEGLPPRYRAVCRPTLAGLDLSAAYTTQFVNQGVGNDLRPAQ